MIDHIQDSEYILRDIWIIQKESMKESLQKSINVVSSVIIIFALLPAEQYEVTNTED